MGKRDRAGSVYQRDSDSDVEYLMEKKKIMDRDSSRKGEKVGQTKRRLFGCDPDKDVPNVVAK